MTRKEPLEDKAERLVDAFHALLQLRDARPTAAREALTHCQAQIQELGAVAAGPIARRLLASPWSSARCIGAEMLGTFAQASTAPALIQLFRDPQPTVRLKAAESLRQVLPAMDAESAQTITLSLLSYLGECRRHKLV